jgi:SAM-dependent methyltransferase
MPPVLPFEPDVAANLPPARSYVDRDAADDALEGWILLPDREIDSVRVYLNGMRAAAAPVEEFPATARIYPHIPHAGRSGFRMRLDPGSWKPDGVNAATVVGFAGPRPAARRDTFLFEVGLMPPVPTPPAEFIEKTQGGHDPALYRTLGFRYYHQLRETIRRWRPPESVRDLLDLGCGSGRVTAFFLAESNGPRVAGGDIDADAVAWCQKHLRGGAFGVTPPFPPLPYPDGAFDVVFSLAVFAAFGPDEQAVWLPELRRILRPEGLALVSVQGTFSASFLHPPRFRAELDRVGVIHGPRYEALRRELGLRPYLGVYQTRAYTWREWSKHFEVLELLEGEINADQDLVVLRRRAC